MTLSFPNRSRSFESPGRRIRFVGHDGVFEIPFMVEIAAFVPEAESAADEVSCLAAFDAARPTIEDVASEAYSHGRKSHFVLTRRDFR